MEHRGEILRGVLEKNDVSQRGLARMLSKHHNTVANYMDRPDLPDELLLTIGKKIRVDMGEYFPSLRTAAIGTDAGTSPHSPQELGLTYLTGVATAVPETLPACQLALMQLQARHINLLTDYLNLVQQGQHAQVA